MHISMLGLFDYVARQADLTVQEMEHLQDCGDCREETVELQRLIRDSGDVERARRCLGEEATLPLENGTAEPVA